MFRAGRVDVNEGLQQLEVGPSWLYVERGKICILVPFGGAESDFCGRNGRWKGLIFRHNRVHVQNQGAVLKKVASVGCTQAVIRPGRVKTSVDQSAALIPAG